MVGRGRAMSISIAVRDLRKAYADEFAVANVLGGSGAAHGQKPKFVLDGLSFDIVQGERVGIIGENGAGKSTLLRIMAGLTRPTSGSVDMKGRVHAALTLGVGLREELTGRQNLVFDGELQGVSAHEIKDRTQAMVDFADLGEFIDRPVKTYSTGMKSRLGFTGLVFIEPEILLIDEALSAGDQWFQKKANAAIRDLCSRGKIVIIVSHSRSAIVEMCSRCLWLHSGKIEADGEPGDVTAAYSAYQRARDEKKLSEEYSAKTEASIASGSAQINRLKIAESRVGAAKAIFLPDATANISFDISTTRRLASPSLRLRIERVDGLIVTENQPSRLMLDGAEPGTYRFDVMVSPLLLGPSMYLLFVELFERGELVSRSSIRFKVETDRPMVGGCPSLYVPIAVSAERVELAPTPLAQH